MGCRKSVQSRAPDRMLNAICTSVVAWVPAYIIKKMEMKVYLFYIQKMLCMAQYFTWKTFVTFKASLYCIGYFKNAKNWGLRTTSAVNRAS